MRTFFLLFLLIGCSINAFCQDQQLDDKTTLLIEAFHKNKIYESNGLSLWRANRREPSRRDSVQFHQLVKCSFPFSYIHEPIDNLPLDFGAYGFSFQELEKGSSYVKYVSEERDSEIHYITFYYDEFSEPMQMKEVEITSLNTRSNQETPKYMYRFIKKR